MTASLVGRIIARTIAIESLIGAGSVGVVYRARHLGLNTLVAVKVLRRRATEDPAFDKAFHRETKTVSQLDHPNIVRVVDFGEEPDGLLYVAMELVQGIDLVETTRRGWPLSDDRIVDVLTQTLDAIAAAHDVGIIHGNLKPKNILVVNPGDDARRRRDVLKVSDFGAATFGGPRQAPVESSAAGAKEGALALDAPEFMSPEQCRGEHLDPRSDVYSVGVILFQLLAGRPPFTGSSRDEVALRQRFEEPRFPAHVLAKMSPKLEAVCRRALRKRREDRYASAREMHMELRAAVNGAVADSVLRRVGEAARLARPPPPLRPPIPTATGTSVAPTTVTPPRATGRGRTQLFFVAMLAVCAAAYVVGVKRSAAPRSLATMSAPATASILVTTSVATGTERPAEMPPPPIAALPASTSSHDSDSRPVVKTIGNSRKKSAHAITAQQAPLPSAPVDPGNGRVSWKIDGVAGGATAGDVARAIDHIIGSWNECYQSGLRARSANVEGRATLRLSCDDKGRVVSATLSEFDMPDVSACIRATLRGITIPHADTGEASAIVALSFAVTN